MTLAEATALITQGIDTSRHGQTWADLGAGSGLFTRALAQLLDTESRVYAIDQDARQLKKIKPPSTGAHIITQAGNLLDTKLHALDGILIANAMHYVADSGALLQQFRTMLMPTGRLVVIEYNSDRANHWVPYPVSYHTLAAQADGRGWTVQLLTTHPSRYNPEGMYAALLTPVS